jgi:hypothetical protein
MSSDDEDHTQKKRKTKKKKDPNAPKRGMSGYMFFCKANRAAVKEGLPETATLGEIGKAMGLKWKDTSEEDRKPYEDEAAADKERYQTEMSSYEPPSSDDEGGKKKKKRKKDPNAPKKALSSYMFFCKGERPAVKASLPEGATIGEIGKAMGAKWSSATDEDKVTYVAEAEADKIRYEKEMAIFKSK